MFDSSMPQCKFKKLSPLMLCALSKRRRPFSYHSKMADFLRIFVFCWISRERIDINSEKCIEYGN